MSKKIAVCVDDIIFSSKIANAAKALQIEVKSIIGSSEEIVERIKVLNPSSVFLDLNSQRLDAILLIRSLKRDAVTAAIPITGFLAHVDTETRSAAIDAGCDRVLPRSVFVLKLPEILSGI